jgi:NADPH2:quinone reductase
MCVACDGLYLKMDPPLSLPWEESKTGSPILLWGGATQVGIQAIQLAKLAGCEPIIVSASKTVGFSSFHSLIR